MKKNYFFYDFLVEFWKNTYINVGLSFAVSLGFFILDAMGFVIVKVFIVVHYTTYNFTHNLLEWQSVVITVGLWFQFGKFTLNVILQKFPNLLFNLLSFCVVGKGGGILAFMPSQILNAKWVIRKSDLPKTKDSSLAEGHMILNLIGWRPKDRKYNWSDLRKRPDLWKPTKHTKILFPKRYTYRWAFVPTFVTTRSLGGFRISVERFSI